MIKIFNATDTDFKTAGNIIINPLHCHEIKKKSLNGWYIEVEIPIKYKEYIEADKLCVVKTKSKLKPQAFRINDSITYTNRKIKFTAEHVMFDSRRYVLLDVRPTNLNGQNGLKYVNERTDKTSPFSIDSNVENISTAYFIRKTLLESWQVFEERWGGVFEADNWDISFKQSIGKDNGETIVYGKNMQGFEIFEDWSNVCTKILPVGYDGLLLPEKYLESETQYEIPYTKIVDFQTDLKTEEQTETNLLVELRNNASKYLEENCVPKVSYTVNSNVNNDLEIGDTIKVLHPFVNIFTEVLEYEYDLISEKVKSLTFGNYTRDVKTKFNNIKNTIETIKQTVSKQEITIKEQTNLINSLNKNGYVYIDDNEILILDQLPKEKAKNVWRFGLGGIGFSSKGYEGPFETAITMDGKINADFITTGTMAVDRIESLANFITDTSASIAAIELQQDSITTKVSSVEKSVENITNTQNTATEKNIHLEDSSDDTLVSIKVKGSTSQVTRSGKNIFNKNAKIIANGVTKSVLDTGVRITQTSAGQYRYGGKRLGGSELLGKTLRISANWTKSADNVPYIAVYLGNSSSMALYSLFGTGVSGQIIQITIPNAFPAVGEQVCDTVYILLYSNRDGTGNVGDYVDYTDLIVTVDNDDMTYEDYGVSPSSDYRSPIENVEGKNKLDYKTVSNTPNTVVSLIENGFNVSGYYAGKVVINNLKKNTNYYLQYLTQNITGTAKYVAVFAGNSQTTVLKEITSGIGGVFNTGENTEINIWFYGGRGADKIGEAKFTNIQLEEGTVATPYVPYNLLEIKDTGENLFNPNNVSEGYVSDASGNILSISGQNKNTGYIEIIGGEKYFILSNKLTGNWGAWYDKDKKFISGITLGGNSSGIVTAPNNAYFINFTVSYKNNNPDYANNVMIARSDKETPYKPYQEQKVTFPLENQKLMEGSYLASDGIHHTRKQVILNGGSNESWFVSTRQGTGYFGAYVRPDNKKNTDNDNLICDYFKHSEARSNVTENLIMSTNTVVTIIINNSIANSLDTLKSWLSENPITVEYELATEEIVPYTEAQQEAWDKIEQLHTYKNVTNIFSDAELDIVYVRDNGLSDMYETKQNASKNYTKTSTEIQQLDDSIKRTISQIGDRSQKTTTVTEDIDGIKNEVSNIQDLTQTTNGTKTIVLSNCVKGNLLKLQIKGNNTVFKYLYPSDDLYPSDNLLPMGDSRILVNGTVYELGITDVLRKNGEVYDEFVLENGQAKVIRRINTDGTVKTEEMTEDLGKLSISLNEGTNTIKILNYTAEITAKYVIKNNYTDIFATKVEMSSSIEQTAEGIKQVVYKKVDEDEIISKVNQSAEEVGIDANRININGAVSANGNFKIDTERKHEM